MHSDLTLDILDQQTTDLGDQFRRFKVKVCSAYHTQELDPEVKSQTRQLTKEGTKWAEKSTVDSIGQALMRKENKGEPGTTEGCALTEAAKEEEIF
jgi:hypothetical protein